MRYLPVMILLVLLTSYGCDKKKDNGAAPAAAGPPPALSVEAIVVTGSELSADIEVPGTILAFEVDAGSDGYLNNISQVIHKKSLEEGVLIRPLGNTVYIMPPYCITDDELEKVYSVLKAV